MAIKKLKFNVDGAEDAEPGGGSFYDGPVPPKGVYRVTLKFMNMKKNKNDDPMLNGVLEITEKGDKAQYNGYGIWFNQNITKQGAPYVNEFLDAFGYSRKAFWGGQVAVDDADADPDKRLLGQVTKIGTKKTEDLMCRVSTKRGSWNDEPRLEVGKYLPMTDTDGEDDDDVWGVDADADTDADSSAEEEDGEEEEGEEEDGEEDGEEEDGEEDEDLWTEEALSEFDRDGLKEIAREYEVRVLKKDSDADLIAKILAAQEALLEEGEEESGEPPF